MVKNSPPFSTGSVVIWSGPGAACSFVAFIACLTSDSTKNTFSISVAVFF